MQRADHSYSLGIFWCAILTPYGAALLYACVLCISKRTQPGAMLPDGFTFALLGFFLFSMVFLAVLIGEAETIKRQAFLSGRDWPDTSIAPGQYDVYGVMGRGDLVTLAIRHEDKDKKQIWLRLYELPRDAFVGELSGNTLTVTKGQDYCHYKLSQSGTVTV